MCGRVSPEETPVYDPFVVPSPQTYKMLNAPTPPVQVALKVTSSDDAPLSGEAVMAKLVASAFAGCWGIATTPAKPNTSAQAKTMYIALARQLGSLCITQLLSCMRVARIGAFQLSFSGKRCRLTELISRQHSPANLFSLFHYHYKHPPFLKATIGVFYTLISYLSSPYTQVAHYQYPALIRYLCGTSPPLYYFGKIKRLKADAEPAGH